MKARSAAKVNLTLDITGILPNGYHTLSSVVHTVGLCDEVTISVSPEGEDQFTCNLPELVTDNNLCLKALRAWRAAAEVSFGAAIHLEKHIPFGAGLGGGSGNAAAVLVLLQELFGHPVASEQLSAIAAKLGADVPLFLQGGALLMEGIGDVITPLSPLEGWLVLVKPPFGMGTPEVYKAWDEAGQLSAGDTPAVLKNWPPNIQKLTLGNDLILAVERLDFVVQNWLAPLKKVGATAASMTGSGSALFGVFPDQTSADVAARELPEILAKDVHTQGGRVFVAPFSAKGVEVLATKGH